MDLTYALLSTAAEFTPDGRLWVIGGDFDQFTANAPYVHPAHSLVLKLLVQPLECGREHRLRVALIDPDGRLVGAELELRFNPGLRADEPYRPVGIGLVVNCRDTPFERQGDYAYHLLVDDLEVGRVPVRLVAPPAPPAEEREPPAEGD